MVNPKLAEEWHPIKNGKMMPEDVTFGSAKKVWWKCKANHEWEDMPNRRSIGRNAVRTCPYCSGYRASKENCLEELMPELAKEWHPIKNKKILPSNVTCYSSKKVWWKCKKGHEWSATVANRAFNGSGCPYCSATNKRVCLDTCLANINPELSKEWHPTKNGKLTPYDVTGRNGKKVWWKCKKGHEWKGIISDRATVNRKSRCCPYCCGQKPSIDNCFGTINPELSKEWHPTKNGKLTPYDVTPLSNKKAWWKCKKGHEWNTSVSHRTGGSGCPYCNGVVLRGGVLCASIPEAYMYLKYKHEKIKFKYNKIYDKRLGHHKYDFYLIDDNKYVEVTSFTKNNNYSPSQYYNYLRNIDKKRKFVENVLKAQFQFTQIVLSKEHFKFVNENRG